MRTFFSSFGFVASRFAGLIPQAEGSNPRFQIQGSLAEKGEGEMARVFPFAWRISFSRRRGRVARGKPLGLVFLPYAGRVAGSATGADVAARAVATSRRSAARWAVRPAEPPRGV